MPNWGPRWDVVGYYDSIAFKKSDVKQITAGGLPAEAWQPESSMDVAGIRVVYRW